MGRLIDRTGQIFSRLTVLRRSGTDSNKKVIWRCACICGNEVDVPSGSLVTGNTASCGCLLKEKITKHGGWKKSSYNTWRGMVRRCTVETDSDYPRYGGSGITVCQRWLEYTAFAEDMGEPEGDQTLDRIDPYGPYTKENCRWASPLIQARNTRLKKTSTSGVNGVAAVHGGKWMAYINSGKKRFYGAVRNTIDEASADRKELERLHWGVA